MTEEAQRTAVATGESVGYQLRNDHVVRQHIPGGQQRARPDSPQTLVLHAITPSAGHARKITLMVFDPSDGNTLQVLTPRC